MNPFTPTDSINHNWKKMKPKNTAALSPYALFLFRLFAVALAALIICASVNASSTPTRRSQPRISPPQPIFEPVDALPAHDGIGLRRRQHFQFQSSSQPGVDPADGLDVHQ